MVTAWGASRKKKILRTEHMNILITNIKKKYGTKKVRCGPLVKGRMFETPAIDIILDKMHPAPLLLYFVPASRNALEQLEVELKSEETILSLMYSRLCWKAKQQQTRDQSMAGQAIVK